MTGYTQVYTGNGKGKTTAAVGLALRACGAGLRVFFGQFIKSNFSSEIQQLKVCCPRIEIVCFGRGGFVRNEPEAEDVEAALTGLEQLQEALISGKFDLVIADEATDAVSAGLISTSDLLKLMEIRSRNVELVFTGRNAAPELIEKADLVTEMKQVKHYFDAGVEARLGIEF